MNTEITESERAALEVLKSTGIDVLEAALVAKEALECGRGRVRRARECVRLGAEEMRKREKTVTFRKAVETALEEREKKNRRARTVTDFRYYCKRMMVRNPGLAERRMRSISSEDCRKILESAFGSSPSQYRKARAIMSGVFSAAIRHDWCDANPVSRVEVPDVVEKPTELLKLDEAARLEETARQPEHQDMQLSLHLMLYCGIRPTEVSKETAPRGGRMFAATRLQRIMPRISGILQRCRWRWGTVIPACCVRGTCMRGTGPKRQPGATSATNFGFRMYKICAPCGAAVPLGGAVRVL